MGLDLLPVELCLVDMAVAGEKRFVLFSRQVWYLLTTSANSYSLQAFRNLNSVTVPKIISVPKNKEEDAARGN